MKKFEKEDAAIEYMLDEWAAFLDPEKRPALVNTGKYWGVKGDEYQPKAEHPDAFKAIAKPLICDALKTRGYSAALSTDYQPEKILSTIAEEMGLCCYGVFPCKTHSLSASQW